MPVDHQATTMSELPSRLTIILAGLGALACIGLVLAVDRYPTAFEHFMRFSPLSVIAIALGSAAFDWAAFGRLVGMGIVAHGESEPRYRDYAGVRLALVVLGAVVAFTGVSERWESEIIANVGFAILIGSHAYMYWAVFRDLRWPKEDKR
jgi:hypothetical protein